MAQSLSTVAQYAEDQYYKQYREDSAFFDLPDFIFHCGAELAEYLRGVLKQGIKDFRKDKEDDIVNFSDDWLLTDPLDVVNKNGNSYALLKNPFFSIPEDPENSGLQDVIAMGNNTDLQLERINSGAVWRLKYLPVTNRIFWYIDNIPEGNIISFVNYGIYTLNKVLVQYVPSITENSFVPDGVVSIIVNNTVAKMREIQKGEIVKKSLDGNNNKVLEGEIDKRQLA